MVDDLGFEISEESAEKLEVTCGHCGIRIRIRSLADHVTIHHSGISGFIRTKKRN